MKPPGRMVMVPSLVTVTRGSMVRITTEFIVQVSPEPIVMSELIIVLVSNIIEAASASCENPINPRIKILAKTGITNRFLMLNTLPHIEIT